MRRRGRRVRLRAPGAMANLLKSTTGLKVFIVGHTDNKGTLAYNTDLSQRRAASADALGLRRRWRGLLTCAAHDARALRRAALIGADAALLSPIFATALPPASAISTTRRFAPPRLR